MNFSQAPFCQKTSAQTKGCILKSHTAILLFGWLIFNYPSIFCKPLLIPVLGHGGCRSLWSSGKREEHTLATAITQMCTSPDCGRKPEQSARNGENMQNQHRKGESEGMTLLLWCDNATHGKKEMGTSQVHNVKQILLQLFLHSHSTESQKSDW